MQQAQLVNINEDSLRLFIKSDLDLKQFFKSLTAMKI